MLAVDGDMVWDEVPNGGGDEMKILYLPNSATAQQRQQEKPNYNCYPVRLAMEAEWHRRNGDEVYWNVPNGIVRSSGFYIPGTQEGKLRDVYLYDDMDKIITSPEGLPFLSLPAPDRVFTRAKDFSSGNYKYLPGTHILSASGCWWAKCSFCVEKRTQLIGYEVCNTQRSSTVSEFKGDIVGPPYELRPVASVIAEIEECKRLGFREIFDDAATLAKGEWLDEYLSRLPSGLSYGCNCRLDYDYPWERMKKAGFRMVLFGLESANQETLDRINKGVKVEEAIRRIKEASKYLDVHIAVMFGYSWESDEDAERTLRLVHYLLRRGYAKSAQASFFTQGVDRFQVGHRRYIRKIYQVAYSPIFWFHQLKGIRNKDDLGYLFRKIRAGLTDYK